MKLGLNLKIDVTKIQKEKLYKGSKGTYLDVTTFVDVDTKDQYDNNGFISQSVSKEERDAGVQTPILGNVKIFYNDNPAPQNPPPGITPPSQPQDEFKADEDIPFN